MKGAFKILIAVFVLAVFLTACAPKERVVKPAGESAPAVTAPQPTVPSEPQTTAPATAPSGKVESGISDEDLSNLEKELNSPIEEGIEETTFQ